MYLDLSPIVQGSIVNSFLFYWSQYTEIVGTLKRTFEITFALKVMELYKSNSIVYLDINHIVEGFKFNPIFRVQV